MEDETAADHKRSPQWRRTLAVQAALYAAFSLGVPQLIPPGGGGGLDARRRHRLPQRRRRRADGCRAGAAPEAGARASHSLLRDLLCLIRIPGRLVSAGGVLHLACPGCDQALPVASPLLIDAVNFSEFHRSTQPLLVNSFVGRSVVRTFAARTRCVERVTDGDLN
jgi:hypothetical protein